MIPNPLRALVSRLVDERATELLAAHILTLNPADKHILLIPETLDFEEVRHAVEQLRGSVLLLQATDVSLIRLSNKE